MSKPNPVDVYKEYLAWFNELAKTEAGCNELRDRKAFAEWANPKAEPVPYTFGLWFLNDRESGVDEAKLYERMTRNRLRNRYTISEANKHVGGNPNAPLLNPEYIANAKAWHAENQRRREADPEWMAHDAATTRAQNSAGPVFYENYEKTNPTTKPISKETPVNLHTNPSESFKPYKPGILARIAQWLGEHL